MSIIRTIGLQLHLYVTYNDHALSCVYDGKQHSLKNGENIVKLCLTKVEDMLELRFDGFSWRDTTQAIKLKLCYKGKEIPLDSIVTFVRKGNKGMAEKELKNTKEIFHNGLLIFRTYRRYFQSYICRDMALVRDPADLIWHIDKSDKGDKYRDPTGDIGHSSDIVLLGSCHLNGTNPKWIPSLGDVLCETFPDKKVTTFAPNGINDWALLHNAIWFAKNHQMKNLLLTMNIGGKFVAKSKFLDHTVYVPSMGIRFHEDVPDFEKKRLLQKYTIRRKTLWYMLLNKKLQKLSGICESKKINLQLMNYTSKQIWFKEHKYTDLYNKYIDKDCLTSEDRNMLRQCYMQMIKDLEIV